MVYRLFFYLWFPFLSLLLASASGRAGSITPMEYYNSLVAGNFDRGFRDGAYAGALFSDPSGICFDETGERIFVADSGNNRIRVIDLSNHNSVETLAGTGTAGNGNGPFENAAFNKPYRIVALPGKRLAVADGGDNPVRLLDLKTRTVSPLTENSGIWDMVYRPQDDSLYFSRPWSGQIGKLDLKSLAVSIILTNNPQVPSPQALCIDQNKLFVADANLPGVYELVLPDGNSMDKDGVVLKNVGEGDHIQEMAFSNGVLYALQMAKEPMVRIASPKSEPVILPTQWGFFTNDDNPGFEPFLLFKQGFMPGFAASPSEPGKLYISRPTTGGIASRSPGIGPNAVISVKDYHFEKGWFSNVVNTDVSGLTDFEYPEKKPSGTYRILVTGDSRTCTATRMTAGNRDGNQEPNSLRTDTFPKQLEVYLNTEASLKGVGTCFEVLTLSRPGKAISSYAYEEIPPIAQKYGVDMVLGLAGSAGPDWKSLIAGGSDARKNSMDSAGSLLKQFSKKLDTLKTSGGSPVKLVFMYVPSRSFPNDYAGSFWRDLCAENNFSLIDLTEPFDGLKTSYYPVNENSGDKNYTAYGSELIGLLLSRSLVRDKLIPFEPAKK